MDNYNAEHRPYHLVYTHSSNNHLYLGDLAAASNLNFLHSHNVNTVVTAALGMDHLDYSSLHLHHLIYPLLDPRTDSASQFFEHFHSIVEKQIKLGSVLVHCSSGISRAPTLVIAYLMKKQGLNFRQALEWIRRRGRNVMPSLGFERQLKVYESVLKNSSYNHQINWGNHQHKRKYNRIKFGQPHLPILNLASLHSPLVTNSHSVLDTSATVSPKRTPNLQIRRLRLNSSETRNEQMKSSLKTRRSLVVSQSQEINNFEVRKLHINERAIFTKRSQRK